MHKYPPDWCFSRTRFLLKTPTRSLYWSPLCIYGNIICWLIQHTRLDFHCNGLKYVFDIGCIFCWYFEKWNIQEFSIFLFRQKEFNFWLLLSNDLFTFAWLYSTTFLVVKSDLFPTNILFTFALAWWSISSSQYFTLLNDF